MYSSTGAYTRTDTPWGSTAHRGRSLTYAVALHRRFTGGRHTAPVKDSAQSMRNAEVTYDDGRLTLRFQRARDSADEHDLSFAENCYYFIFPVDGGTHSGNNIGKHVSTPFVSAEKICIGINRLCTAEYALQYSNNVSPHLSLCLSR